MATKNLSILSLISIVILLLYIAAGFFASAAADDFCISLDWLGFNSAFEKWHRVWNYTNGRFFINALLLLSPLNYLLENYNSWIVVQTLFIVASILLALKILFNKHISIALVIVLLWFHLMPHIPEGLYWLTGSAAYSLSWAFAILHLAFWSKNYLINTKKYHYLSLVFLFLSLGFNEVQSFFLIIFHGALLLNRSTRNLFQWHVFLIALIGVAIMVAAPGNIVRASNYAQSGMLLNSLGMTFLQCIRFGGLIILNPITLIFALLIAKEAHNSNHYMVNAVNKSPYIVLVLFILLPLFISSFLPYFTTGILGQHRTINWAILPVLIGVLILSIKLYPLYSKYLFGKTWFSEKALLFIALLLLIFTGNTKILLSEFAAGKIMEQKKVSKHFTERIKKDKTFYMQEQKISALLFTYEIPKDSSNWMRTCALEFYEKSNQKND